MNKMRLVHAVVAVALLAGPVAANSAIVSGSWNFTATVGAVTYSGSFSVTGLDTDQSYTNSTAAGFAVSTSFDTSENGGNAFNYDPTFGSGLFTIGGLAGVTATSSGVGALQITPAVNDWYLVITGFGSSNTFNSFGYRPIGGGGTDGTEIGTVEPVPLPAAAWLLLSGVGGLGVLGRRRKVA